MKINIENMSVNHCECPRLKTGMSLRECLRILRGHNWGNIGTLTGIGLSDYTELSVELCPASDGGLLLSSQRAVRREYDRYCQTVDNRRIVRTYKLK